MIEWEEHVAWFKKQLAQKNPFYIIERNKIPCGYVRFAPQESTPQHFIVSIAIETKWRGCGLGTFAIEKAIQKILMSGVAQRVIAYVKKGNKASCALFEKAHFTIYEDNGKIKKLKYPSYEEK